MPLIDLNVVLRRIISLGPSFVFARTRSHHSAGPDTIAVATLAAFRLAANVAVAVVEIIDTAVTDRSASEQLTDPSRLADSVGESHC